MTVNEARKIIAVMMVSYPNFKPIDTEIMATTWADMLSDYSYEQINVALKAYIRTDTSGFAPSIGQLVGKLQMVSQPQELNEMEAWSLVSKAIRNGYYGAEEEFAKLPEVVQKAVGNPANLRAWAHTDVESIENVVQSNFMRTYRTVVKRESECAKLPPSIKNLIEGRANDERVYINGISEKIPEKTV